MNKFELFSTAGFALIVLGAAILAYLALVPEQVAQRAPIFANIYFTQAGIANQDSPTLSYLAYAKLGGVWRSVDSAKASPAFLQSPPLIKIAFLNYSSVNEEKRNEFRQSLIPKLENYGFEINHLSIDELPSLGYSVLIIDSGIWPSAISSDAVHSLLANNNAILFFSDGGDYIITPEGAIEQSKSAIYIQNGNISGIRFKSVGRRGDAYEGWPENSSYSFVYVPKRIGSTLSSQDASNLALQYCVGNFWQQNTSLNLAPIKLGLPQLVIAYNASKEGGYLWMPYELSGNGGLIQGYLWTSKLLAPTDTLHPTGIYDIGNQKIYSVDIYGKPGEQKKLVIFSKYSSIWGDYDENQPLGSILLAGNYSARYSLKEPQKPGDYILSIVDWEGNQYGSTLVGVVGLNLTLKEQSPPRYTFCVEEDGMPANGPIFVSFRNDNRVAGYSLADGCAELPLKTTSGEKYNITIEYGGKEVMMEFEAQDSAFSSFYLRFGIPLLLAFAVLFFFLRSPEDRTVVVVVPELPDKSIPEIQICASDLLGAFEKLNRQRPEKCLPLSIDEIQAGIESSIFHNGTSILVSRSNVMDLLFELEAEEKLAQYGGYWAPVKWLDSGGIKGAYVRRKVYDIFLHRGIICGRASKDSYEFEQAGSRKLWINWHSNQWPNPQSKIQTTLIFADYSDMESFRQKLNSLDAKAAKLKILISSQWLQLKIADDLGVE